VKNQDEIEGGKVSDGSFGELLIDHGDKPKIDSKQGVNSKTELNSPKTKPAKGSAPQSPAIPELIFEKSDQSKTLLSDSGGYDVADKVAKEQQIIAPKPEDTRNTVSPSASFPDQPPLKDIFDPSGDGAVPDDQNLVPGGFMNGVPNPQAFFKSRYRSRRQSQPLNAFAAGVNPEVSGPGSSLMNRHGDTIARSPLAIPPRPVQGKPRIPFRMNFVVIMLAIMIFGAGFLIYRFVGSSPEKLYGDGMTRTGKALEKLNGEIFSPTGGARLGSATFSGSISTKYPGEETSSRFDGSLQDGLFTLSGEGTVTVQGQQKNTNYSLRSSKGSSSLTPEIYLNTGPSPSLASDFIAPGLTTRPNVWFVSEEALTKSVVDRFFVETSTLLPPGIVTGERIAPSYGSVTPEAFARGLEELMGSTREHIFTSKDKGIFEYREFVGEEQQDDFRLNHYSVGIQKERYQDFCKDIKRRIGSGGQIIPALLGVSDQTFADPSSCDVANVIPDNTVVDIWIDADQKILQKMRVYTSADLASYREFGQSSKADRSVEFYYIDNDSAGGERTSITMWYEFKSSKMGLGLSRVAETSGNELSLKLDLVPGSPPPIDNSKPSELVSLSQFLGSQGKSPADLMGIKR